MEGTAAQHLIDDAERQRDNILAENAGARKAMGWPEPSDIKGSGEEMDRQTIIGDVIQPPPVVVTQGGGNSLSAILLAGILGAAIPGAGIGGVLLSQWLQKPKARPQEISPEVRAFEDETVELKLRKIDADGTSSKEEDGFGEGS